MRRFWNFTSGETENTLRIDGYIAEDSWFGDEITPKMFRDELQSIKGDMTVWLNSGGGDCFAASQIYTMLKEYKGKVTMKIDGIAASAASVVAMAGDEILMSPSSLMMLHNPAASIFGEVSDLEQGIEMLNEVKEAIINAYQLRTGMQRAKISKLMDAETWLNSKKAVELGFADGMLYEADSVKTQDSDIQPFTWNSASMVLATVNAMKQKLPIKKPLGTPVNTLEKRLELLKY